MWRDLKANKLRYLALGLLIVLGMYLIVSLVGAAETVIQGVEKKGEMNHLEDGEFGVFVPLSQDNEQRLTDKGISLERMFYLDYGQEDGSTLRVYGIREQINLIDLAEGRLAVKQGEAVLEKRYCEENGIAAGGSIELGGAVFEVVGIGSVPDYEAPYRNLWDSSADSRQFGLMFVNEGDYSALKKTGRSDQAEEYVYAYRLNDKMTDDELKEELKSIQFSTENVENVYLQEYWEAGDRQEAIGILTQFMKAQDNPRIKAAADDQIINKNAGLISGIIVMVLFTYVISVFVIHGIEKESSIIGTLYALGVKRRELLFHYLLLPVFVTFAAGIVGTVLGYSKWGINVQMGNCYDYFSVPKLETVYSLYLLFYGVVMPPLTAAAVNYIVIRKHLARPALELIRSEPKSRGVSRLNLGNMGFTGRFRIRQLLREARAGITVIFGMFTALLIMMLGINCYVMCMHISVENKEDTKYGYMYTYKYPEREVPSGAEACFAKTLKKEVNGYDLDVTLLGIDQDIPYFDARPEKKKNQVVLSSAMSQKYGLKEGDQLILSDREADMDYAFTVQSVTQFSTGMYAFMDIGSMRELFRKDENYYNVVFSDGPLDIDQERLYGTVTKEEIFKSSDIFVEMMMPMIYMMTGVALLIFCVVMYLMMKVMTDRSAYGISLMKIFGYRTKEIRKLYLSGNFYMIAAGAAICIPVSKKLMDIMYPTLVSNVSCGMNLTFSWQLYLGIYAAVIGVYLIINQLLVRKLRKILPAQVLKNRE